MARARTGRHGGIHYWVSGSGPANLVLLHGWGGSSETWEAVVTALKEQRFRVLVLDLRGHGKSDGADCFTWEGIANDVLTIAEYEQMEQFVPVGFSLGGKLACYLAANYPKTISRQVLVGPAGPGVVPLERESSLRICREVADWQKARRCFLDWFGPEASEDAVEKCCRTMAQTPTPVLEKTAELGLWTSIALPQAGLTQPTLIVTGDNDPVYGMAYQETMVLPWLRNAKVERLKAGHFMPLEKPRELAKLIERFE